MFTTALTVSDAGCILGWILLIGRGGQTLRSQLMSPLAQKQKCTGFCCAEQSTERVILCEAEQGKLQGGVPRVLEMLVFATPNPIVVGRPPSVHNKERKKWR
jgi:hypothetical protein